MNTEYSASPESQALVTEARRILQTLDPLPSTPSDSIIRGLSWGIVWQYAKGLLLWHTPEKLSGIETEEERQNSARRRTVGEAAAKLEAARALGRNDDALFLLAEMNFVSDLLLKTIKDGLKPRWALTSDAHEDSMEIGRIHGTTKRRSPSTRSWPIHQGIILLKIWLDSCMRQALEGLWRGIRRGLVISFMNLHS